MAAILTRRRLVGIVKLGVATNANGKTGVQGTFATRGFLGDYEIEVKAGGKTKTVRASLSKGGARIECVLD